MKIREELVSIIEKSGLSDGDFANKVGIHFSQLSRYKAGKSIPRKDSIKKIQEYYPEFLNADEAVSSNYDVVKAEVLGLRQIVKLTKNTIADKEDIIRSLKKEVELLRQSHSLESTVKNMHTMLSIVENKVSSLVIKE